MASKRDMLRKMNEKNSKKQEERTETLVTELVDNYDEEEKKHIGPSTKKAANQKKAATSEKTNLEKTAKDGIIQKEKEESAKILEKIDTSDLVGTARRRVSQRISKSGAEKLQKLNRTTISLSENNEEYVMSRCDETGASITVTINKIIQEYRELKGIK